MSRSFLQSQVNAFIALVFVGTCAFGAGLIIVNVAYSTNPLTEVMASYLVQ